MQDLLHDLLEEVNRQYALCASSSTNPSVRDSSTGTSAGGCPATQNNDRSYCKRLAGFRASLAESLHSSKDPTWSDIQLGDPDLLWMIPAHCASDHPFHSTKQLRQQFETIQHARALWDSIDSTDGLWENPQVAHWAAARDSSLLLVEGNHSINRTIGKFGLEMSQCLEEQGHPTAYFPNMIKYEDAAPKTPLNSLELLRQLTLQILQRMQPANAVRALATIIKRFQDSRSSHAWVMTFGQACQQLQGPVYVIIDLRALGDSEPETEPWPSLFLELFARMRATRCATLLKLALLNYRGMSRLVYPPESPVYVAVASVPRARLPPEARRKMLQTQRRDQERKRQAGKVIRPIFYEPEPACATSSKGDGKPFPSSQSENTPQKSPPVHESELSNPVLKGKEPNLSPSQQEAFASRKPSLPRTRESIRIVVICALTLEADAVQALFDCHWDDDGLPFERASGDTNAYSVGAIGCHNILLLHMPGMGKVEATRAAAICRSSFINIQLALVVGICGGVPFRGGEEIVLGDVVISDGIIQYDFGRQLPGNFLRKDTLLDNLGRPNPEIRGLLSKLRGLRGRELLDRQLNDALEFMRRNPRLCADYPGAALDNLYESAYHHNGEGTCEDVGCDGNVVPRKRLQDNPKPVVHFGLIASGDKVIQSAEDRDLVATAEGVAGFEMEGAGVWDTFPCVVIKGVCDYADSHKSKSWQRYAAATAAACMKGFLKNVSR